MDANRRRNRVSFSSEPLVTFLPHCLVGRFNESQFKGSNFILRIPQVRVKPHINFYLIFFLVQLIFIWLIIIKFQCHFIFRFSSLNRSNIKEEKLNPTTPRGYWDMMAYNNSKLCNILFGMELQRLWRPRGVDVFTVHPGNMVNTSLQKHSCFLRLVYAIVRPFTKSLVNILFILFN